MLDEDKTKDQLIIELNELRRRVAESEKDQAEHKREEAALAESEERFKLFCEQAPLAYQSLDENGCLIEVNDITARKLAEEDLKETNSLLENILENSPDAIGMVDIYGRFIRWNKMAEEICGYTFEEMKGKAAFDLYANKDELEQMLVSLRREDSVKKWEMRLEKKDGAIVPIEISIGLLKDRQNETIGSVCLARDLSGIKETLAALRTSNEQLNQEIIEHKRTEEALLESENKFKSFAEQALAGIYIIQDGLFKYVNPRFAQMFGYTVEECLNDMPFNDLVYAEDLAKAEEWVRRRTSDEADFVQRTFRGLKKNGQIFHLEVYGTTSIHKGKPAASGTIVDITERKRAEEALAESEEMFRLLVESAPDAILVQTLGLRAYANPAGDGNCSGPPAKISSSESPSWIPSTPDYRETVRARMH